MIRKRFNFPTIDDIQVGHISKLDINSFYPICNSNENKEEEQ